MKNRIFNRWGRNDRDDDENVDRVLKRFFAGEVPPEIPRSIGGQRIRLETSSADPGKAPEERHSLAPALIVAVAAVSVVSLAIWWRGKMHEAAVDHKLASADVAVPAVPEKQVSPSSPVSPSPVEAKRPLQSDLPFYSPIVRFTTTISQGSPPTGAVEAEWARVCLIDPTSAMQLVLELPTELRIYQQGASGTAQGDSGGMRPNLAVTFLERSPSVAIRQPRGSRKGPVAAPRPSISKRPYLGVFTAAPGPLSSAQPFVPLGGAGGLLILSVLPGSPAAAAGLRPGEILVAFQDQPLAAVARFSELVAKCEPGQTVRLFVLGSDGYRTVEAEIASRTVSTAWDAPREWELPPGVTIHGKRRLMLTKAGWPVGFSGKEKEKPSGAQGFLVSPADGEYELIRLTSDNGPSAEQVIERGDFRELLRLPVADRLRSRLLEGESTNDAPLCRIVWLNGDQTPSLDVTIRWKTDEGRRAFFAGRFSMEENPHDALDWLLREPLIERIMGELPAAARRELTHSLKTVSFPAVRRRVRSVQ